jgi:RHS repeat-associated protein
MTNASFSEYIYFAGKRVARHDASGNVFYYMQDALGTTDGMVEITANNATETFCYDADFYPYGGEKVYTNTCPQNYKFEGKERDAESGNDDFGARYYSSVYGRWLSPDWSSVPAPVPYANLNNPQTLNLYAMVSDNPETFSDLDGHDCQGQNNSTTCGKSNDSSKYIGNAAGYYAALVAGTVSGQSSPSNSQSGQNSGSATDQTTGQSAQNTSQTQTQTQTQPKQLSAEDVSKAIQSAKQDTGPNAKKAVDFLNSLGTNWNLSGDILRQALKDSKVDAHGVDKNVDSVARSGDKVTVQLNKGLNFLEIYKTKTTISFDVGDVKGRPALLNIQGVEVFHGYHYVPKTDYGPN